MPFRALAKVLFGHRLLIFALLISALIYLLKDQLTIELVVRWSAVGLLALLVAGLASLPILKRRYRDSDAPHARAASRQSTTAAGLSQRIQLCLIIAAGGMCGGDGRAKDTTYC